jgi:hypothetical protein
LQVQDHDAYRGPDGVTNGRYSDGISDWGTHEDGLGGKG